MPSPGSTFNSTEDSFSLNVRNPAIIIISSFSITNT
jgi:hypothetical protein